MAIAFLFKLNNTDYTGRIVQNSYKVNNLPVYKEYKDANDETHRRYIRHKFKGSFQMVFKDVEDYLLFRTVYDACVSQSDFSCPVTLYDNLTGTTQSVNAFLDYEPTVQQTSGLKEYMKVFDVTVEER